MRIDSMFRQSLSASSSDLSTLRGRLRGLETEIERLGRKAGHHASASLPAVGDHINEAVVSAVEDILARLRAGGRRVGDEAWRLANDAARLGGNVGSKALERANDEIGYRPLTTLAVAVGIGILIGLAGAKHRAS
jgi:ElaB/YqjD/DUF883 family membrane-anchored ribosome-binding protein